MPATAFLLFALAVPCVYSTADAGTRASLETAGVERICTDSDLAGRETLPAPGTAARAGVASPTRAPWIVASGWRFMRNPGRKYVYDVPAGKAAPAAADAFAYGAGPVLKIGPAAVQSLGEMLQFPAAVPLLALPQLSRLPVL